MVSWVPTYPGETSAGYVGGYGRFVSSVGAPVWSMYTPLMYRLASNGSVDAGIPTRFQYPTPGVGASFPAFQAVASFDFTADDVADHPGRRLTGTMFIAPASAYGAGHTPSPQQIIDFATIVVRGTNSRNTAGQVLVLATGVVSDGLPPNTKYWLLVAPTHVADMGLPPSAANDLPVGNVNVTGRAVSMWSNRTPLAPVITEPARRIITTPGSDVRLSFVPKDPDRISTFPGDQGKTDMDDLAGIHVQYAPEPTVSNPDPSWRDLPVATTGGTGLGRGWYIEGSATAPANDGMKNFWLTYALNIRCGTTLAADSGLLPSGKWQIRIRTFDYGHPLPDGTGLNPHVVPPDLKPPLADETHLYTPANYPAANTSPWSAPVFIAVSEQVPAPTPIAPKDERAVVEGSAVVLSWLYRNTYVTPLAQKTRTVDIRKVGSPTWTSLAADQASSSASITVSGFPMVSGNRYEWRVKVTDTSNAASAYSETARFWYVPAPGTGAILPVGGESIDGATLGCGTYRVEIYRRGGKVRVGELDGIEFIRWNRVRDDISAARVVVKNWGPDCGALLKDLQTWAYEMVLFRDNGYTEDRVWEGPITLLTYKSEEVVIQARDVMVYAYRRIIKQAMSDTGNSPEAGSKVTERALRVLQDAFARDDPNLLAYLQVFVQPDDAKQYRNVPAYGRTAFEEVDDMASNAGLDYTAVGRAILLWGTKHRIGTLPEFRDKDLGESPIVSEYGMSFSNVYAVSDGNGVHGEANRLNSDGQDPNYGLVEMLSSTWASESESPTGTYTQAGLDTIRASFAASSERSIADRYPPPVVVRIPDNTRLHPDTVLSIQHLVPGVVAPLRSTSTLREVVATQKLDQVQVEVKAGEESISITMSPFSRDDIAAEGEAE